MDFSILGPLAVHVEGRSLDLGGRKQRAVLAMMLVDANRVVAVDRLIDGLWGDKPPPNDTAALHVYVSHLRRLLEPGRLAGSTWSVLVTEPPGYRLVIDEARFDAACFETEVVAGVRLAGHGQPQEASDLLRQALGRWRGPVLADFQGEAFTAMKAAQLDELRLVAVEERLAADLALGAHRELIGELEAQVAAFPYRERLWALLMLALYRSDRQAEALRAFTRARQVLRDELGLDPGPALRRLENDILAHSPTLDWEPPTAGPADRPGPAAPPPVSPIDAQASPRLLERDGELATIEAICRKACGGVGGAVAVIGPPGIGKSELLSKAANQASSWGLTAVLARGGRLDQQLPFATARHLFDPLIRRWPDTLAQADHAGAVLGNRRKGADRPIGGEDDLGSLLQALYWLLADCAERSPLLLVLDDAHWIDTPSLRLASFLIRRLADLPVAVVLGSRPVGPETPETLKALHEDPAVKILELPPLSVAALTVLIANALGGPPDEAFTAACAHATGGNPFLLSELLSALSRAGVPPTARGVPELESAVAVGVGPAILRRLGRLPPAAAEVARGVAVLETPADTYLTGRLANLDPQGVAVAADYLVQATILTAGRPFTFTHPLVRNAVYADLGPGARALWHRRAAQLLEDTGAPIAEVAAHLQLTDPAGDAWVVDRLTQAAAEASGQGAPEIALPLLQRARAEPPPAERRLALTLAAGRAAYFAGDRSAAVLLRRAYQDAPTPDERRQVASLLRAALVADSDRVEAVAIAASERDETADPMIRLRATAAAAQMGMIDHAAMPAAAPFIEDLIASVPLADNPAVLPDVLGIRTFVGACANEPADRLATVARAAIQRLEENSGSKYPTWFLPAALVLIVTGHPDTGDVLTARLKDYQRVGDRFAEAATRGFRARWSIWHGDLAAAEVDARLSLDALTFALGRRDFYLPGPVADLLYLLLPQGQIEAGQALLSQHGLNKIEHTTVYTTALLIPRARLRIAQGRHQDAIDDLRQAGRQAEAGRVRSPAMNPWRSELALALHRAKRPDAEALALANEELCLAEAFGARRAVGVARHALGVVTGDADLLRQARDDLHRAGDRLALANTLLTLGCLLRRRREPDARVTLMDALDVADRIGATAIAADARTELLKAGARPRRNRPVGAGALTPAELRTATLAATGATNREIAQTMIVSVKTVEAQLAGAYRKLECDGRAGLAAALST